MDLHASNHRRSPFRLGNGLGSTSAIAAALLAASFCTAHSFGALQDEIRIRNISSANSDGATPGAADFLVRTARIPVFVEIDLGGSGTPQLPEAAASRVVAALDANPRRLVTLKFKGAALRFEDLSRGTREILLDKRGDGVVDAYNEYLAGQLLGLTNAIDSARPGSPLAIQGLPFEGRNAESAKANEAYGEVLERMDAIVLGGGMMVSGTSEEASMLHRAYPHSVNLADGRAILFASNGVWRIATPDGGRGKATLAVEDPIEDGLEVEAGSSAVALADFDGPTIEATVLGSPSAADLPDGGATSGTSAPSSGSGTGGSSGGSGGPPTQGGGGSGAGGGGGGGGSAGGAGGTAAAGEDSDGEVAEGATDPDQDEPVQEDDLANATDAPEDESESSDGEGPDGSEGDDSDSSEDAGSDEQGNDAWDPEDEVDEDSGPADEEDGDAGDLEEDSDDSSGGSDTDGDGESGAGDDAPEGEDGAGGSDSSDDDPVDEDRDDAPAGQNLFPGAGFAGEEPQAASVGDPLDPHFDSLPVARWNVVPHQMIDGAFELGVIAFHPNGIDRVEFSAAGGDWIGVDSPSVNPRTGVEEFWCRLDPETVQGSLEVRARVIPAVAGRPMILQNAPGLASDPTGVHDSWSGVHALFLRVPSQASQVVHVSADGSDDWSGTEASPCRTLERALLGLKSAGGLAGGKVVIQTPGEYAIPSQIASGSMPTWVTISAADHLDRRDVVLVSQSWADSGERGTARPAIEKTRWQGVTFDWGTITQLYPEIDQEIWFDQCDWIDRGGRANVWNDNGWLYQLYPVRMQGGIYATDCTASDQLYGFVGLTMARNCHVDRVSGDSFTNTPFIVHSRVTEQRAHQVPGVDFHCDVLQYWGDNRNLLVFGLEATGLHDVQPIFLDKQSMFDGVALVNLVFDHDDDVDSLVKVQLNSPCRNVLFQNVSLADHDVVLRDDLPEGDRFEPENVILRNLVANRISRGIYGEVVPVPGMRIEHCHCGDPGFVDSSHFGVDALTTGAVESTVDPDGAVVVLGTGASLLGDSGRELIGIGEGLGPSPDRGHWGFD